MTAASEPTRPLISPANQVRRAWAILALAALAFVLIAAAVVLTLNWVYRHATEPEIATLHVLSGTGALVRSPGDEDWRLVSGEVTVREGDSISTALGTVVTLDLFDGSTVEVTEDTIVRVARMRSSRFLNRTKLVVLEPERGTVYVAMEPRGEHVISEITTRVGDLVVTMTDEKGRNDAGSYLVEVVGDASGDGAGLVAVRAGVLHGGARVKLNNQTLRLEENQQTVIGNDATFGEITPVLRELVFNGDFSRGLSGWVEFEQESQRHRGTSDGTLVELAQDTTPSGESVVVELTRVGDGGDLSMAGIRQRIGKTLRVHTSLQLRFDARIAVHEPASGGDMLTDFPLVVQIDYIDVDGQEQVWSYGYYVVEDERNERHIPLSRATKLEPNSWQQVIFDLRRMTPVPQQITSIVVYASGQRYQTRVANISLTTSELAAPDQ